MPFDSFTLTGSYKEPDTSPQSGTVVVAPSVERVIYADENDILLGHYAGELDENGEFAVILPDPNDPNLNPSLFGYVVTVRAGNGLGTVVSTVIGPEHITAGGTLDMSDVTEPASLSALNPTATYVTAEDIADITVDLAAETAARVAVDTAEATTRAGADTALDGRLDVIEGQDLDARITALETALAAALDGHVPGSDLGTAELTSDFTTTNISTTNVSEALNGGCIPLFSVTVVGTGHAVDVEFYAPQVRHSVATQWVAGYFIVNGVAQGATGQTSMTSAQTATVGRPLRVSRPFVLEDGVSYTFKVGIAGGGAGTSTVDADDDDAVNTVIPYLKVTAR